MLRPLVLFAALTLPTMATAQTTLTTRASKFTVAETADRLAKAVEAKGIKVAARFDHAAGAKAAGLELPPTIVVLFGNPKLGTPVMHEDPRAGIDLPMKVLVWQDKAGKVWIGYTPPATLQARYGLKDKAAVDALKAMNGALEAFTKAAAESE